MVAAALGFAAWISGTPSRGQDKPGVQREVQFRADEARADPERGEVELEGGVVVTYDRFRLTSRKLAITLGPSAVEMRGTAKILHCPCKDPPVSLEISGARATGQGDLELRWPRLYFGPIPVFILPWLLVRPADRVGLLPPRFAMRGDDGALLGAGARFPWRGADGKLRAVELYASGYVQGGVELGARIEGPTMTGRFTWDRLRQDRFVADTHGFVRTDARPDVRIAWDLDAIRGARGLVATPSLTAAAQPFDVGAASVTMQVSPGRGVGAILGTGLTARARRGEGPIVWGPTAFAGASGAVGRRGSWEANTALAMLSGQTNAPYARAEAGIEVAPRLGPLFTRARLGTRARLAGPEGAPMAWDAVAEARGEASVTLERSFGEAKDAAPLVHRITPRLEARGAVAQGAGTFFQAIRPDLGPVLGLAALSVSSSIGSAFGSSLEAEVKGGFVATNTGTSAVGWASAEGTYGAVSARVEAIASKGSVELPDEAGDGISALAELRVGLEDKTTVLLDVYGRAAGTGALARSLGGGLLLGDTIGIVAERGLLLGLGYARPLFGGVTGNIRADADVWTRALVGMGGALAYRHPDGCVAVEVGGSRRAGRKGTDIWVSVDLVPPLPTRPVPR
ncbi:hypothetical protein [Polyangium jinanense]|uniref:Uncharacterized protein n=1 Tax=Polyangium jinanense TaxID=2829994 RepID=A0A9X3XEP1_9BACT|nr:hypothetical protein [Polyangium jinanense]MDC3961679.1 hypothetical protein [Polyangium jinanense]MDC3983934.1 hypothetical protein [Polyangium jinanense]MDC3987273.1 hypothetical protein [Polyangium jinanense]